MQLRDWVFSTKRFEKLLDALKGLEDVEPFDPVWDGLYVRLPELQRLTQQKLARRGVAKSNRYQIQNRFRAVLERLRENHKEAIEFHEMRGIRMLEHNAITEEAVEKASQLLETVEELFETHGVWQHKVPGSRSERRDIEDELRFVEDRLAQIDDELVALFDVEDTRVSGSAGGESQAGQVSAEHETGRASDVDFAGENLPDAEEARESGRGPVTDNAVQDDSGDLLQPADDQKSEPEQVAQPAGVLPGETNVWKCYSAGSCPGAYWLSFGIAGHDAPPAAISDALLACALQPWVGCPPGTQGHAAAVEQLARIYQHYMNPVEALQAFGMSRKEASMLVAAASMPASLFEPSTGAQAWLQLVADADIPFGDSVRALAQYAATSAWMDMKSLVQEPQARDDIQDKIERTQSEAREWLNRARTTRFEYHPATLVARYLASETGPLGSVMAAILNRADPLGPKDSALLAGNRGAVAQRILDGALKQVGKPGARITGAFRTRLLKLISDGRAIHDKYEDAHKGLGGDNAHSDRKARHLEFVENLFSTAVLEPVGPSGEDRPRALKTGLAAAIRLTRSFLTGNFAGPDRSWTQQLQLPLFLLKESPVSAQEPLPESLSADQAQELADALEESIPWHSVALLKAENNDFYGARCVLDHLKWIGSAQAAEVEARIETLLQDAHKELAQRLARLRSSIERATIDSTLSEQDKSEFDAVVLAIENQGDLRFDLLFREIGEWEYELLSRGQARAKALREHLDELNGQIAENQESAVTAAAAKYAQKAAGALEKDDTALADEFIGRAEDILRTGVVEPEGPQDRTEDWVRLFLRVSDGLSDALEKDHRAVRRALLNRQSVAGIITGGIPATRLEEIQKVLGALESLKNPPKSKGRSSFSRDITEIMTYLGFLDIGPCQPVKRGEDYGYFRVKVGAEQNSPIPQFGSGLNGVCDVVIVWKRPGPETLAGILGQLSAKNPLVLYVGRMTRKWRTDWGMICRQNMLTALVVDDVLVHFLANQYSSRLGACVSCAMLWGYANPYSFSGSIVPPEMFKGREKEIQQIENPLGSAVVYGGRQLGKSATLREFARRSHKPGFNRYVVYRDIKQVGKPGSERTPASVWRHLSRGLQEAGLPVSPKADAGEIVSAVNALMAKKPDLRIWVLLDEADDFLRADGGGRTPFPVVHRLKTLMDSTERRFKVVFSGLHSVQKYCNIPNHPFAHFEAAMVMGPLEPKAAVRLIKEPLAALGFRFRNDDPVYRILAYTNSHPALVQLFCSEIVKMAVKRPPPHTVTVETVEMVFKNQEIRNRMRERFDWTLDLDDRYAVLAYAIIDAQKTIADGYRKVFSVEESLYEARQAWPAAFTRIREEECRDLLDELIGLGILVKTEGGYRLRNANIVTALGSKAEIEERLRLLGQKAPPTQETASDRRQKFGESPGWHPLTLAQEAVIRKNKISFVFASRALGIEPVTEALHDVFRDEERIIFAPDCSTLANLETQLRRRRWGPSKVAVIPASYLTGLSRDMSDTVAAVNRVLSERSYRKQNKVIVVFDAPDIFRWHLLPDATRDRILGIINQPVVSRKWEPHAIEMMLKDEGFVGSAATVNYVKKHTGGWPCLLHGLYASPARRPEHYDPKPDAKTLWDGLGKNARKAEQFLESTGISSMEHAHKVACFVAEIEPMQPCDIELMETPEIDAETRQALLNTLLDLGIVDRKISKRSAKDVDHKDGATRLVLDPLVKRLLRKREGRL